jgi:hypothetical protein
MFSELIHSCSGTNGFIQVVNWEPPSQSTAKRVHVRLSKEALTVFTKIFLASVP